MDITTVARIVRSIITDHGLPCALVLVQEDAQTFRITIRDEGHHVIRFDVVKGTAAHVREAVLAQLEPL